MRAYPAQEFLICWLPKLADLAVGEALSSVGLPELGLVLIADLGRRLRKYLARVRGIEDVAALLGDVVVAPIEFRRLNWPRALGSNPCRVSFRLLCARKKVGTTILLDIVFADNSTAQEVNQSVGGLRRLQPIIAKPVHLEMIINGFRDHYSEGVTVVGRLRTNRPALFRSAV